MAYYAMVSIAPPVDTNEPAFGTTLFRFVATRSGDTSGACSATWTKTGTTVAADFDVGQVFTGTVSFAPAATTANIDFLVKFDALPEDNESITVTLSDPVDCVLIGTLDDDAPGTIAVTTLDEIEYTPPTDFVGEVSFPYVTSDGSDELASSVQVVVDTFDVTPDDGDTVAEIENRVFGGPALEQATLADRPTLDLATVPGARLVETINDDRMAAAVSGQILTVAIVFRDDGSSSTRHLLARDTSESTDKPAFELSIILE